MLAVENIKELKSSLTPRGRTQLLVNGVCDPDDPQMARLTRDLLLSLGVEDHEIQIRLPHNFAGTAPFEQMQKFGDIRSFKRLPNEHLSICKVMANTPGILWDGRITVCGCLDHKGSTQLGNIKEVPLSAAREGQKFRRFVEGFRTGDVSGLPLCDTCDAPYGSSGAPLIEY